MHYFIFWVYFVYTAHQNFKRYKQYIFLWSSLLYIPFTCSFLHISFDDGDYCSDAKSNEDGLENDTNAIERENDKIFVILSPIW